MRKQAKQDIRSFTLRIESTLLRKFEYIADSQDRSMNWMLIQLVKKSVKSFEDKHGEIILEQPEENAP